MSQYVMQGVLPGKRLVTWLADEPDFAGTEYEGEGTPTQIAVAGRHGVDQGASPSNALPQPVGTASAGSVPEYARADHVHAGPTTTPHSLRTNHGPTEGPPDDEVTLGANSIAGRVGSSPISSITVGGGEVVGRPLGGALGAHEPGDLGLATQSFVSTAVDSATEHLASETFVVDAIGAATVSLATETYVDNAIVGVTEATTDYVDDAVSGLAPTTYVDSAVEGLASENYVDDAVDGLASEAYVNSAVEGLASETYVDEAVSGLASEQYVDGAVSGLASEQYVDGAIEGLASEAYVDDAVSSAVSGLASEQYVDDAIANIPGSETPSLAAVLAEGNDADGERIVNLDAPQSSGDAATKGYVDGKVSSATSGLATESYVDSAVATKASIGTGPSAGRLAYWSSNDTIAGTPNVRVDGPFLSIQRVSEDLYSSSGFVVANELGEPEAFLLYSDDTDVVELQTYAPGLIMGHWRVTGGSLSVNKPPVSDIEVANKLYVDEAVAAVPTPTLAQVLSAGASAGNTRITDVDAPSDSGDAATKGYVDNTVATKASIGTGPSAGRLAYWSSSDTVAGDQGITMEPLGGVGARIAIRGEAEKSTGFFVLTPSGGSSGSLFNFNNNAWLSATNQGYLSGDWTVQSNSTLSVPTPTQAGHAASKGYVDDRTPPVDSGTYTPTVHSVVNYSPSYASGWWIRVGNIVHMGITIGGTTVGTGPNRQVLISLPVPRSGNFPNNNQVGGSANYGTRTTNNVFPAQVGTEGGTQRIRLNASDPSANGSSRTWSASLYYSLD